jgi:hypothetical protein
MEEVEEEVEYGRRGKVDWVVVVPKGLYTQIKVKPSSSFSYFLL